MKRFLFSLPLLAFIAGPVMASKIVGVPPEEKKEAPKPEKPKPEKPKPEQDKKDGDKK